MAFPQLYSLKEEDNGEGKVANSFPFSDGSNNSFFAMVKLTKNDEVVERTKDNFVKVSELNFSLNDVIRRIVGENSKIGNVSVGTFSNERDEEGNQVYENVDLGLSFIDRNDGVAAVVNNEIISGYYQGDTISYFSEVNPTFQIQVELEWIGETYNDDYTYTLINLNSNQIIQTITGSGSISSLTFNAVPAYNNQTLIYYKIEQTIDNENWSTQIIINTINYNSENYIAKFKNTYEVPEQYPPDCILYVDALVPPENGIWENQIEDNPDMKVGGTFEIVEEDILKAETNFYAFYLMENLDSSKTWGCILNEFTFYLIAKIDDINKTQDTKHQDILVMGNYNYNGQPATPFIFDNMYNTDELGVRMSDQTNYIGNSTTVEDFHVYAFSKEKDSSDIKVYMDGDFLFSFVGTSSIQYNKVCLYLNAYLKAYSRYNPPPSTLNLHPNYYKMFAYSDKEHTAQEIADYTSILINRYNLSV